MKKCGLVCAAVLLLAVFITAPAKAATTFNFGIKAGASMSDVKWSDDLGDEKSIFRPTFGAFALINLTPMLAIQPEVNYLVTGEAWASDTFGTVSERFTYLHVPVLVRARLMKEGKLVPVVFAGPVISFLLSAKETGEGDVKSFFKTTDFGADFGAGVEIGLSQMKALVDLRYYLGIPNAYKFTGFTMKNRALMLTVGLIF